MKKIKNYNIFKESLNDKLTESNINLDDDGFGGYIIYTYGMDDKSLLNIYKLLYFKGYKIPHINRIEDLTVSNYNKTFLFLLKLEKNILSSTRYFKNDYTDICDFLANCGYDDKYYMFKDYNEIKRVFKPLKINNYFNNKNIYESLLDEMRGPNEEEVLNNFLKQSPRLMLRNSAKHGFMLGVEKALEKGVNIENDFHIITNAVEGDNIDIVKLLVSKGAPLGNFSIYFINATKNGNLEMLKYIKSLGGNLNFRINVKDPFTFQDIDKDLMEYAAYYGHTDIIDYLVENGLDVNSPQIIDQRKKPLFVALENHRIDAVKTLLKHGAEVLAEVKLLLLHHDYKKYQSIFNEYKKK